MSSKLESEIKELEEATKTKARTVTHNPSWAGLVNYFVRVIKENDIGSVRYNEAVEHFHHMGRVADITVKREEELENKNHELS